MDSRNYEELISGSRPHWQQLDVDGAGFGVGVTWVMYSLPPEGYKDTFLLFTLPSPHPFPPPTHTFHPIP